MLTTNESAMNDVVPAGYMMDAKERLIPVANVDEHDKLMDEFVRELIADSKAYRLKLSQFKLKAFGDCQAFIELLAEKYERSIGGKKRSIGGKKGNMSFVSFDGSSKIVIQVQDHITFGPELQIAKDIIDELVGEWSEGANENLRAIIADAFQVDKQGNISTSRVLSLRRIKITDPRWQDAMTAISESVLIVTSKSYIRFYEKDAQGEMKSISLDFSKL